MRIKILTRSLSHGRIGTGKTHLLQILNLLASGNGSTLLLDSNLFSSECSKAAKLGNLDALIKRYVRTKYLFFDDIHLLKTKPFAQQQLGLIVEERRLKLKPTILTAKLNPNRLEFSSYVTSRLSGGGCDSTEGALERDQIPNHQFARVAT